MKRGILLAIFFCRCILSALCYPLTIPDKTVLHVFAVGGGAGEFIYQGPGKDELVLGGPQCLVVDDRGDFIIADDSGIFFFDKTLALRSSIPAGGIGLMNMKGSILVGWRNYGGIVANLSSDYKVDYFQVVRWDNDQMEWAFLDGNYIFSTDQSKVRAWRIDQTQVSRVPLSEWTAHASSDLVISPTTVGSKSIGFLTADADPFFKQNKIANPNVVGVSADGKVEYFDAYFNLNIGILFGIDGMGRRYFDIDKQRIFITDKNGKVIKLYACREGLASDVYLSWPTVTPNGDIYYIESSPREHKLIKLPSLEAIVSASPDQTGKRGTLNDSDVRLRLDPSVTGTIITQMGKGAKLTIIDQTKEAQTIAGQTSVWFNVRLADNTEGWVFGAFVDVQK